MVCGLLFAACLAGAPSSVCCQYLQDVPRFSPVRQGRIGTDARNPGGILTAAQAPSASELTSAVPDSFPAAATSVSPAGALYRSLAVPGWGQWRNGRRGKAVFFFLAEAICIGGYLYENALYTSGDYSGPDKNAIKTDRNSFLLYWMVAKVLDIMDAYVDAQFQSFDVEDITPPDLKP